MGKATQTNKTTIFKLFWTPHEGIISKSKQHMGENKQQKQNKQTTTIFRLVWLRGPMARLV